MGIHFLWGELDLTLSDLSFDIAMTERVLASVWNCCLVPSLSTRVKGGCALSGIAVSWVAFQFPSLRPTGIQSINDCGIYVYCIRYEIWIISNIKRVGLKSLLG